MTIAWEAPVCLSWPCLNPSCRRVHLDECQRCGGQCSEKFEWHGLLLCESCYENMPAFADERCAHCEGLIPETEEVITRGHSFHESCADLLFGE